MSSKNGAAAGSNGVKRCGARQYSVPEKIVIVGLTCVILVCLALMSLYATKIQGERLHKSLVDRIDRDEDITYRHYQNRSFGSEDAPVEVIAVLPFEIHCHNPTIEHLYSVARANPADFRVSFFELHSPEGLYQLQEHDLEHCAAVIIEGSAFAKLPDGSDVPFIGAVDDKFTIEELSQALEFTLANKKSAVAEQ